MLKAALLTSASAKYSDNRIEDLASCLEDNIKNVHLEEIHLFVEDAPESFMEVAASPKTPAMTRFAKCLESTKIRLLHHGIKPTYSDYFEHANRALEARVVIVAAPDIAFDKTLVELVGIDFSDSFLCLSRNGGQTKPPPEVSQDAWIFRTPFQIEAKWPIGTLGGDNKLAGLAWRAGYVVLNPCVSIKTRCINKSNSERLGGDRLPGPYLNVYPIGLESVRRCK